MTGMRIGRLTVTKKAEIYRTSGGRHVTMWECVCDCGNTTVVSRDSLRGNRTKSCGCLIREMRTNGIVRKSTEFDMSGEYGIGYTTNTHKKFYFDKDDYDVVKDYSWYENDQGYILTTIGGRGVRLHRLVFGCDTGQIIDHRNHNRADNRKENLRIASKQQNGINRGANKNNKLGIKGVSYDREHDLYFSRIMVNGETIYLGSSHDINDAISLRKEAEIKYFGEFAFVEEVV